MSRIRGKDTVSEKEVFKYLRREKVYFQKHYEKAPGKPDIALPKKKKAVFIDGDFWHGRHLVETKERLPSKYWKEKIEGNAKRDQRNRRLLKKAGWEVLRVWGSNVKRKRPRQKTLDKVTNFLCG